MSGDKTKNSVIHTTYQALFVIYAPVALLSILVKFITNTYVSYFYLTSILVAALSIVIGVVMCIQFWRHRHAIRQDAEAHIPYILRHRFMIMYIPIAIGSLLCSSYYIFDKYVKAVEFYGAGQYRQVSVLFPVHNAWGREMADSQQAKQALGAFMLNNPELSADYHFTIFDHKNSYSEELEAHVADQLRRGTNYFICAYSDVCKKLATNFERLEVVAGRSDQAILITTLSSSMDLPLQRGQFYRFFVRNREEATALASYGVRQQLETATFVATDDAYGRDAVEQFKQAWQDLGGDFNEGVFVDPAMRGDLIAAQLRKSSVFDEPSQAVFVAHYQDITPALEALAVERILLFSSNYQADNLQRLVATGVPAEQLIVSLPRYKVAHQQLLKTAGSFIYMTLEKLIYADQKSAGDLQQFHRYWQNNSQPNILRFQTDGDADFKVEVEVQPYRQDMHSRG